MARPRLRWLLPWAVLATALAAVYGPPYATLVSVWWNDPNYSHGFLITPLAAWFVYRRREALARVEGRPAPAGLLIVLASLGLFVVGTLAIEVFTTRVSLVGVLAGTVVYTVGWQALRVLAFPLAFLLLMIPIPAIVFYQIALPLQLAASSLGETALQAVHVPVVRDGNVLVLPHATLQVAEACSGIRSIVSLLALALVCGEVGGAGPGARVAMALATVPIAIAVNALRVATTGALVVWVGPWFAEGTTHEVWGAATFVASVALLLLTQRGLAAVPAWGMVRWRHEW